MAKQRTISEETQHQELSSLPTPEGGKKAKNRSKDVNGADLSADTSVEKGIKDVSDKNINQDAEAISESTESTESTVISTADLKKGEEKATIDESIESEVPEKEDSHIDTDLVTAIDSDIAEAEVEAEAEAEAGAGEEEGNADVDAGSEIVSNNENDTVVDSGVNAGTEVVADEVEDKSAHDITDELPDTSELIPDRDTLEKTNPDEELTVTDETGSILESESPGEDRVEDADDDVDGHSPEADQKTEPKEEVKGGKPESEKENNFESQDFSNCTIEEVVEVVKKLALYKDLIKADKVLRRISGRMKSLREEARNTALEKFTDEGGDEDDFSYKADALFDVYDANFRLIKDRRHIYLKELEKEKESNLAKAEIILDQLRTFLDNSETSASFRIFKEIQNEWKSLGSLPGSHYKSLWANYNALVSRFYDRRSIYFELIELDRKKNLEYKLQLCEKAESLESVAELKEAIIQLNELHHEFKHTGPVPRAEQEAVWQQFKAASDKVYARRKEYNTTLKKELDKNLELKLSLAEKVQPFTAFNSDSLKEWNEKSREILNIQKEWEKVGGLPRDKAKEVNKKFWSAFKRYFSNKNHFFKKLEGQRVENLNLKEALIVKAEELKDSTDWDVTSEEMKALQQQWKEIGPVPEKVRNEVYKRFKAACDHFFNCRRDGAKNISRNYEDNLNKKQAIIKEIQDLTSKDTPDIDKLKKLQIEYYDIGYVPKSKINAIHNEFTKALQDFLSHANQLDDDVKDKILLEGKIEKIKHSPNADRKLYQKEQTLKKQINQVENDISLWKNNIEFFANTKNAEKLKEEFNQKIINATKDLERMKKELRLFVSA